MFYAVRKFYQLMIEKKIVSHVQNNGKDYNTVISELNHILNKTDPDIINRRKASI